MPGQGSAGEKDRRLKEVRLSRDQIVAQRRNIIKKGVYLAGAGALAATTAGSLGAFIPPYVNPFTDGTYQVIWAESLAKSAWANDKQGSEMKASDYPKVALGGQGQIPELAMNVLVVFLDSKYVHPSMHGTVPFGNGEFASFNAKCKHLGCTAQWRGPAEAPEIIPATNIPRPGQDIVICPCHLGTYDIYDSASVHYGPPPEPLDQLRLLIEDDLIKIQFARYKYGIGTTGGQVDGNPFYTG